ncbi:FAD-dependent oxidoreductase [Aspergillus stella-maris]|uniref:FAD-dependent oxidoreductase n=1 Tax=Aspergillus stella-maris TaxID=1810926 RepID=UPI003CCCC473
MEDPRVPDNRFKVIIAGGSLVGLSLALALERAGIDFELFEKGQFAPQLGASIGLHPHSLRILDQLGVWPDIEKEVVPLQNRNHYDESGHCFERSDVLSEINKILRRPIIFMERSRALQILHSHINDKSKLHSINGVVGCEETADGVTVITQDGRSHRCHILVGADGIHSQVRQLIADKTRPLDPTASKELVEGFTSEYNCIFAVSKNDPAKPFLPDGMVHNVYYHSHSAVAAAGVHGLVFWFLFVKASTPTSTPNCPRFADNDAQALINQYGGAQLGPEYTVRDLWEARVKATMVPLEEGVLKKWSHGRAVLMGDAVHKSTINPGLGGNLAYEGIAHFTNLLVPLLKEHPIPSTEQLGQLFGDYFERHLPRARTVVDISGRITRYEAQDNWLYTFAARHIVPWISDATKAQGYANFSNGGPWLEYLPLPTLDEEICHRRVGEKKDSKSGVLLPKLGVAVALISTAVVGWNRYSRITS